MSVKDVVVAALDTVHDPDLKKSLVALNMIKALEVSEAEVSFTLQLTTPACPLKEQIKQSCIRAIQAQLPDMKVVIQFDAQVTSQRGAAHLLPSVRNIIGVASGKGGVGKSTVAVNISLALAQSGARVGLVDADIFGPSIPTLMDCQNQKPDIVKKEGKNCLLPIEKYGIGMVSMGFLVPEDQAIVWRGPMASTALKQLVGDTEWGEIDYLIVDLPPGTSDIPLTLSQAFSLTGVVVVTTPQSVSIADVRKSIAMFEQPKIQVKVLGIVENMSYFSHEGERIFLFGKGAGSRLAEKKNIPFLGELPLYKSVSDSAESGYPVVLKDSLVRSAFGTIAQKIAQEVAKHNALGNDSDEKEAAAVSSPSPHIK